MRDDAQRRSVYFLQPRPEPNRLNPGKAAGARRSMTALHRLLAQTPPEAVRAILLVEARQSSRIEGVSGEPIPGNDDRPSRLYHALDAALYGNADILDWHQILWRGPPTTCSPPVGGAAVTSASAITSHRRRRMFPPIWQTSGSGASPKPKRPTCC